MQLTNRKGVWYVDFRAPDGRRLRVSTGQREKRDAERVAPSVMAQATEGGPRRAGSPQGSVLTLAALIDRCVVTRWNRQKSAKGTKSAAQLVVKDIGHWSVAETTYVRLKDYCLALLREGRKPGTVNRRMNIVRTSLREASKEELISKLPQVPHWKENNIRERYLQADEEARIFELLDYRASSPDPEQGPQWRYMRALVAFLLDTGVRLSEGRSVGPSVDGKVFLKHGETKNNKGRKVPLTKRAAAALEVMLASPFHRVITNNWAQDRWQNIRALVGCKDVSLHTLRHTCASRLVQRGVSLYEVMKWLGHSSIRITERYAHLAPDALDRAVLVLELPHAAAGGVDNGQKSPLVESTVSPEAKLPAHVEISDSKGTRTQH